MNYIYDKTNQWRCSMATLRWSNVVKISPLLLPHYPAASASPSQLAIVVTVLAASSIMYCLCVSDSYLCAECPAMLCASCLMSIMTYWTLVRLLRSYFRGGNESRMCSWVPRTGPVLFISISSIQLTMLHLPSHFLLF